MTESKDLQEFISKYLERGFGSMNKMILRFGFFIT